ncbi:MAG TPA: YbaK/EbsC family protein [Dermatophilaceae bacterium]|nr:YbaK/EbsC family protein [Dermatophilaceae bacterium]
MSTAGPQQEQERENRRILDHPDVRRVIDHLAEYGARGQVVILREPAHTARHAAEQLGVSIAQIANSLVFRAHWLDDSTHPLLVLTSGAHRVDLVKIGDLLGLARISRADAAYVRSTSGFVIGGVAPVGHLQPMQTVVDVSLSRYEQVWAAAGHPRTVFPTNYDELLILTAGHPAEVV